MTVWRISNYASLDGEGGLRAAGRWHSRGRPIVYCAPTPAAALLEVLVHLEIDIEDLPPTLQYLVIDVPDSLQRERSVASTDARAAGDRWLSAGRTALLDVPSVVAPETWNVLLNPAHPEAASVRIRRKLRFPLDRRLL